MGGSSRTFVHFAQGLRAAGVRTGPAQLETALGALETTGLRRRGDVFHTLRATLITRVEDWEVFQQVFEMFWRDPDFLGRMLHLTSPKLQDDGPPPPKSAAHQAGVRGADGSARGQSAAQEREDHL